MILHVAYPRGSFNRLTVYLLVIATGLFLVSGWLPHRVTIRRLRLLCGASRPWILTWADRRDWWSVESFHGVLGGVEHPSDGLSPSVFAVAVDGVALHPLLPVVSAC